MRRFLRARVRQIVDRVVTDLTELAITRVERELERMGQAFEAGVSSYASEGPPDLITAALGPELAAMLTPTPKKSHKKKRERDYTPEEYPPSRRAREERTEPQKNGSKPITCSKCGFVGGNARGRGRAHPTLHEIVTPPVRTAATPARSAAEVEAARENRRERIERVSAKAPPSSGKPPQLGMRTTIPRPTPAPREVDDDQGDDERWSTSRIADETHRAEASKRDGKLPAPRSSFVL